MKKALVLYWSQTGNTEMMAEAIKEGIKSTGMEVDLLSVSDFNKDTIDDYTHIALGCPATGTEELDEFEFKPVYEAIKPNLKNKPTVLFGSHDWGVGEWMETWNEDVKAAEANLLEDGLVLNLTPDSDGLNSCRELGARLASA